MKEEKVKKRKKVKRKVSSYKSQDNPGQVCVTAIWQILLQKGPLVGGSHQCSTVVPII